jgi:ArsR family transcriptional regulator
MTDRTGVTRRTPPSGDELVEVLAALANPIRLRIMAALAGRRDYVSHLARDIGVSRPLLHMHLQRLEGAGLIVGSLELSDDGKALKYYEVANFDLRLNPAELAAAAKTLTQEAKREGN